MYDEWDHTYRLRPYFRNVGIAGTVFFSCAWVASVLAAYFNVDDSFARPVLAIVIFSAVWGGFTLLSVWLILIYVKYRLLLNETAIRHVGVFTSRSISLDAVEGLKWRLFPQGGSCVLTSIEGKIKIEFANFTQAERTDLIAYLRGRASEDRQVNWDKFQDQFVMHSPARARQQRFAKRVLILALFGFAIVFAVLWFWGLGSEYLVVSLANIVIGAWADLRDRQTKGRGQRSDLADSEAGPGSGGEGSESRS